jgi:nudix-type nucleoside diphosphatase (YffH/AdpP family)
VAALLCNPSAGTVLLTMQFRIATVRNGNPGGILTEVCAGKLDGSRPDETMRREIREETGYELRELQHVMSLFPSPGAYTERLDLYLARYQPGDKKALGGGLEEEGEDITLRELPFEDALAMIDRGEIQDAKTIILLQYAALKGVFSR